MFNIVSPSGNLISLDLPRGREVLAGVLLMACDTVVIEQDPGSSPRARLENLWLPVLGWVV